MIVVLLGLSFLACESAKRNLGNIPSSEEKSRVTSPDGRLDAVLVEDLYGGALGGGVDSVVYITTKGSALPKTAYKVLRADPLRGCSLVWRSNHLLEIHYDLADIHEFRNLWGLHEVQDVGSYGESDFDVEIRLAPLSPDYSLLTPDGHFRSKN